MFKVMLTESDEIVYLTPPQPDSKTTPSNSKKPLSRTTSKQDKLSLTKVYFHVILFFYVLTSTSDSLQRYCIDSNKVVLAF